jgi:hypothetical protein
MHMALLFQTWNMKMRIFAFLISSGVLAHADGSCWGVPRECHGAISRRLVQSLHCAVH